MLHNHTRVSKWRQTQEQRILNNVKQSLEKRKATDPHVATYNFQRFTMSELGPSTLSPNPCRLLMSEFTSLGSAVSPHEMTGWRLKSTLIEKLKSRSPSIYSFKRQKGHSPISVALTPSIRKSGTSLKLSSKDMTLSDLNPNFNMTSQALTDKEAVEELPGLENRIKPDQLKRPKPASNISYATMASSTIKSNVEKDIVDLSITGVSTNIARERLLTHMSREDIEQEALRNRLLEDAGLKKEKKPLPYIKLADRKRPIDTNISGERMRIQQIITADSALARKHQEERKNLLLSSGCVVRTINSNSPEHHHHHHHTKEIQSDTKSITNLPSINNRSIISIQPCKTNIVTNTKLSNYITRQSQEELIATYQQATIKLNAELHEKQCKRNDLQNRLRYLQILASMRLQPDKVPLGFYCYLNLPCCHYSIYSEHHFSIGELCIKCRQRIENCVMIKADIA